MDPKLVEMILADLKDLKSDVKSLLKFKWQIMGGAVAVSFLVTLAFQVLSIVFK